MGKCMPKAGGDFNWFSIQESAWTDDMGRKDSITTRATKSTGKQAPHIDFQSNNPP